MLQKITLGKIWKIIYVCEHNLSAMEVFLDKILFNRPRLKIRQLDAED